MSWHLKNLSLLNWGGYCGNCENVDFEIGTDETVRRAVCVSGENGSGKTTLTDAYLTLMSPVNVTYNAASNRGDKAGDRRSTLSYVKGAMAKDATNDDEIRYLRPEPIVVSGICGEFATYDGDVFWAAIVMQVGMDANGSVNRNYVIADEKIDLGLLRGIASDKIDVKSLRKVYPHANFVFDSGHRYMERLGARLGLGNDFATVKRATKLLSMVQGEAIPSDVNTVFNQFVFPETGIREKAVDVSAAIHEADEGQAKLESVYRQMRALSDLKSCYVRVDEGISHRNKLSRLLDGDVSPYRLWRHATGASWLDNCIKVMMNARNGAISETDALRKQRDDVSEKLMAARRLASGEKSQRLAEIDAEKKLAEAELSSARSDVALKATDVRAANDAIKVLMDKKQSLLDSVSSVETDIETRRKKLNDVVNSVAGIYTGDVPLDVDEWNDLVSSVSEIDDDALDEVVNEISDLQLELRDIRKLIDEQKLEVARLNGSKSNMDARLLEARDMIADECDMDPSELPFVAELIDVDSEWDTWRLAANVALGPVLRIMLVDQDRADGFRKVCDRIGARIGRSIVYRSIDLDDEDYAEFDDDGICSKLVFDETSDYMWAVRRIVKSCDAVCVNDVSELRDDVRSITRNGQIRDSRGGRVGYNKRDTNLIGFDNELLREEAQGILEDYQNDYHMIENQLRAANNRKKTFDERLAFGKYLASAYVWDRDFDTVGLSNTLSDTQVSLDDVAGEIADAEAVLSTAEAAHDESKTHSMSCEIRVRDIDNERIRIENENISDEVKAQCETLQKQYDELDDAYAKSRGIVLRYDDDIENMTDAHSAFVASLVTDMVLDDSDKAVFDSLFVSADDVDWSHFQSNMSRVETQIRNDIDNINHEISLGVTAYDMYEQNLELDMQVGSLVGIDRDTYLNTLREHDFDIENLYELDEETGRVHATENSVVATWMCHYSNSLEHLLREYGDLDDNLQLRGVVLNMINQVADLYATIKTSRRELMSRVRDINAILKGIYLNDAGTRHIEVRARTHNSAKFAELEPIMRELSEAFSTGSVNSMDTEHLNNCREKALKLADDIEAETKSNKFVLDPRNNTHIAIIEHDGDVKVTHDNTGQLSGGEVQQMSTCIVGAALLYVMGADTHRGPSYTTLILDEAFSKSDHLRAQTTLKALINMGFDPVMSMPSDKVMQVSPYIGLGWYVSKGTRRGTSVLSRIGIEDCRREFAA